MAHVTRIDLDEEGNPGRIHLRLSDTEAATIAKLVGAVVPTTDETSEIYNALVGDVFNRYFEEGVSEVPTDLNPTQRIEWKATDPQ